MRMILTIRDEVVFYLPIKFERMATDIFVREPKWHASMPVDNMLTQEGFFCQF